MLLRTSILPRRDGTVRATAPDGVVWVFEPSEDGALACDVGDEAFAARLVRGGMFTTADGSVIAAPTEEGDDGDDEDDEDDSDGAMTAPVEANTPAVRRRGRPRKAK